MHVNSAATDIRPVVTRPAGVPDWRQLYDELGERVFRMLHRMMGDRDLAQDLTHDTFIRVHESRADGLRFILLRDIGDASDLPVFPRLLYTIDKCDPTLLAWFVQKRYALGTNVMTVVMDQASGVSPLRRSRIDAEARVSPFGDVMNFTVPAMADGLGVPDLGEEFRSPIVSNVRTLFLSGTLDWNTPPFQAEEVRWGFPNSSHIIVKNAGHEQVIPHPEVRRAIVAFLKGESVDGVTAAWPPLKFVPIEGYDPARTHPSVPRQ